VRFDEDRLARLFDEVPVPPGVERWRGADVPVSRPRRWPLAAVSAAFAVLLIVAVASLVRPREPGPSPTPADGVWPSAATTGVLDGPPLATHEGDLHVTTAARS
jgi:hypothetical protein